MGSLTSFRARGFRDRDFFFLCGHRTSLVSPLTTRFQGIPRHKFSRRYPRACCTSSTGISFSSFFLFFFFLHHLDLSVLPGQLVCIVYSRNRVSLEPSKFSMMAEIVCTVYVEESRSGGGNLELCLDDIIEGRWNDGVVCLRSLKGSIEIFFVVLVLFESLVFGGLYVIN